MNGFWQALRESTILQALMTIGLLGTICYLYIAGRQVPQELSGAFLIILGFYFGSKTQATLQATIKDLKRKK